MEDGNKVATENLSNKFLFEIVVNGKLQEKPIEELVFRGILRFNPDEKRLFIEPQS